MQTRENATRHEKAANRTAGKPLDPGARVFLEDRFGESFAELRVRERAWNLAAGAAASSSRNDVSLRGGARAWHPVSRAVLAHEAAHVLQWRRGQSAAGEPWSEARLEAEAQEAGVAAATGARPTIRGIAPDDRPRYHPVFISTFGRQGFLDNARDFYIRWGYGTPQSVSSIEEIVTQLAEGAGHIDRMTIVSHAVPDNINISFLRGGPGHVRQEDWDRQRREDLPSYSGHATQEQMITDVMDIVRGEGANAALLARLHLDLNEPRTRQFVWWVIDADFFQRVQPGNAIPNRARAVADARRNATFYKDLLKADLRYFAIFDPTSNPADVDTLENAIGQALQQINWGRVGQRLGAQLVQQARDGREAAVQRVLAQEGGISPSSRWDLALLYASLRFGRDSVIEIKGCRIGQNRAYLEGISRFFAWEGSEPAVTAPDMFQIFGTMGVQTHPDSTAHLRGLWRNGAIRRAFLYWADVFGLALSDPPVADDLVSALRSGLAFPVGPTLHFITGRYPGSVAEWLARFNYHLTQAPDIEQTFFQGRSMVEGIRHTIVDWLQDRRDGERPRQFLFPPDPEYANHIIRVQP